MILDILPYILLLGCPCVVAFVVAIARYHRVHCEYKRRRLNNQFAYKADLKYVFPGGVLCMVAAVITAPCLLVYCTTLGEGTGAMCFWIYVATAVVTGIVMSSTHDTKDRKQPGLTPGLRGNALKISYAPKQIDQVQLRVMEGAAAYISSDGTTVWKYRGGNYASNAELYQELVRKGATAAAEARLHTALEKNEARIIEAGQQVQVLTVDAAAALARIALDDGYIGWVPLNELRATICQV